MEEVDKSVEGAEKSMEIILVKPPIGVISTPVVPILEVKPRWKPAYDRKWSVDGNLWKAYAWKDRITCFGYYTKCILS